GKVIGEYSGFEKIAYAVVIRPDGRLVVGGTTNTGVFGFIHKFTLDSYYANGTVDTTFGMEGTATTAIGGNSSLYAAGLQPDGRIIAAGTSPQGFALARYNSDGSLDGSFG